MRKVIVAAVALLAVIGSAQAAAQKTAGKGLRAVCGEKVNKLFPSESQGYAAGRTRPALINECIRSGGRVPGT